MDFNIFLRSLVLSCVPLTVLGDTVTYNFSEVLPKKQCAKNVLFIAVDDLKPLLGCYGDKYAKTPVIDELANQGSVFLASYCQQALSGPSRASLLTGMCPDRTEVWDLKTLIRDVHPDVVTLPQYFKQNGYQVVGYGKIFDLRSVDKNKDEKSWSLPFTPENQYINRNYETPFLYFYQDPRLRKIADQIAKDGLARGESEIEIKKRISAKCQMSTECLDIPDDAYQDGSIKNGAVDFLERYDGKTPFFLAVGFKRPHLPFNAPKKYWDLYTREDLPLAPFRHRAKNTRSFVYHNSGELQIYSDIPDLYQFSDIDNTVLPENKQRELIHGYYACISYIDKQIGDIINVLKEKKLDKNTIIILWGDHGWHLGDHGLWCKHSNFEQATKAPMIIVDPLGKTGNRVDVPVEFLDIYPTLCDLAGLKKPNGLDGKSLAKIIMEKVDSTNLYNYAVSQYPRGKIMGYSLRSKRYRYTVWVEWINRKIDANKIVYEELYDYEKDPHETINVIDSNEYVPALKVMRTYWEDYKKRRL